MTKKKDQFKEQDTRDELKPCPRCGRKMSWFETDDGSIRQWCYWDQSPFLDNQIK